MSINERTDKNSETTSEDAIKNMNTIEPTDTSQSGTEKTSDNPLLAAGGYELPKDWLGRIALIWSGYALSAFLGNAASYAGIWYVTETTQSPLALALIYVLAFLPMGLLSPLGGVIADKYNRKAIIIISDAILTISAILVAIATAIMGPSVAIVAIYCGIWGLTGGFRGPAFNATMPLLIPEKHLMRINGMDSLLGSVSMIAAPALGILLYVSFGLQASLAISGIGSLAAVITMLLAKLPKVGKIENQDAWASLKEGATTLKDARGLMILTIVVSLGMLAYGPIDSLLPLMVYSHFQGTGFDAALIAAIMGVGMLIGSVILIAKNPKKKLPTIIIVSALIVGAGAFAAGNMPHDGFIGFAISIGILSIACAWFGAPLMTLLQKGIASEKLGRVMGLYTAMIGLAIPIGTALGGVVAEITGTPLFFCIDGVIIIALGILTALSKDVRALN